MTKFSKDSGDDRIEAIVAQLQSDAALRYNAINNLRMMSYNGLSYREGIACLRAATHDFSLDVYGRDMPEQLVSAALMNPHPGYFSTIIDSYSHYSLAAKSEAIALLFRIGTPSSCRAILNLLRRDALTNECPRFRVGAIHPFAKDGAETFRNQIEILFPELVQLAVTAELQADIYPVFLDFCRAKTLDPDQIEVGVGSTIGIFRDVLDQIQATQGGNGRGWMLEGDYRSHRSRACVILQLYAYYLDSSIDALLHGTLELQDPKLQLLAAMALRGHGRSIPLTLLDSLGAESETRIGLYEGLTEMDREEEFPARYRTQELFAESEMVEWLAVPVELNRIPDVIELVGQVTDHSNAMTKALTFYLFRFSTEDENLLGWAGPYLADDFSIYSLGDTFSTFRDATDAAVVEAKSRLRQAIQEWEPTAE
ncbi:MAG: hypothetical protein N2C14_14445 [Planctomycetales bacterium]